MKKYYNYLNFSIEKRRNMLRISRTNNEVKKELLSYSRMLVNEVNKRLRKAKKRGLDYSPSYKRLKNFLQISNKTDRALKPVALNYDLSKIWNQSEHLIKFLSSKDSSIAYAEKQRAFRISRLKEVGVLPKKFNSREDEEFLQFLGNEILTAVIDEYGISPPIVDMAYEAYMKSGTDGLRILEIAFLEFLAGEIGFDEAMSRAGVKVEDYFGKRY